MQYITFLLINDFYDRDQFYPLTNSATIFLWAGNYSSITIVAGFHLHSYRSFSDQEFYLLTRNDPAAREMDEYGRRVPNGFLNRLILPTGSCKRNVISTKQECTKFACRKATFAAWLAFGPAWECEHGEEIVFPWLFYPFNPLATIVWKFHTGLDLSSYTFPIRILRINNTLIQRFNLSHSIEWLGFTRTGLRGFSKSKHVLRDSLSDETGPINLSSTRGVE